MLYGGIANSAYPGYATTGDGVYNGNSPMMAWNGGTSSGMGGSAAFFNPGVPSAPHATGSITIGGPAPVLPIFQTPAPVAPPSYAPAPNYAPQPAPQPMPFPAAPAAPAAVAPASAPGFAGHSPLSPIGQSGGGNAPGSPYSASNPYAGPSYNGPTNPSAFALSAAQSAGVPGSSSQGQAPIVSNGGGGQMGAPIPPQMSAPPPQGFGNPANMAGATATAPPPPPGWRPEFGRPRGGTNVPLGPAASQRAAGVRPAPQTFVPPPPPTQGLPPSPGIPTLLEQQAQMDPAGLPPLEPDLMKLDGSTGSVLQWLNDDLKRAGASYQAFQESVETRKKELDKAVGTYMRQTMAGPQKRVEDFEKPGEDGMPSKVELIAATLRHALDAANKTREIEQGYHDKSFEDDGAKMRKLWDSANALETHPHIKAIQAANNELDEERYVAGRRAAAVAAFDARAKRSMEEYTALQSAYDAALENRTKAFDKAFTNGAAYTKQFWDQVEEERKMQKGLDERTMSAVKNFVDIQRAKDNDEFRNAQLQLSSQANQIQAKRANNDAAARMEQSRQTAITNLQNNIQKITSGKGSKADKAAAIKPLQDRLDAYYALEGK